MAWRVLIFGSNLNERADGVEDGVASSAAPNSVPRPNRQDPPGSAMS